MTLTKPVSLFVAACALCLAPAVASAQRDSAAVAESVRLRGGFGVHPGLAARDTAAGESWGASLGVSLRLGVQFTRFFSVYYMNAPTLAVAGTTGDKSASGTVHAMDYNSLLANLTLADMLEFAAGPSLDYVASQECHVSTGNADCKGFEGARPGLHGRLAVILGGRGDVGPRRSGFALSIDPHFTILVDGDLLTSLSVGFGSEWY